MKNRFRSVCVLAALGLLGACLLPAAHPVVETPQQMLRRAFFLEQAREDFTAAAELYAKVAAERTAPAETRSLATERLALCRHEIATSDLARLVPPSTLVYVETNASAERSRKLLDQLGLLARDDRPLVPGENRLAIRPEWIQTMAGLRSMALAITGFDPARHQPTGLLLVRSPRLGLLESILAASARVLPPVHGVPVFQVGPVYVASTPRLLLLSPNPEEIRGALDHLADPTLPALSTDPDAREALQERHSDMAFFYARPQLLMPLLGLPPQVRVAPGSLPPMLLALLGANKVRFLSGRLDYGPDGLALALTLRGEPGAGFLLPAPGTNLDLTTRLGAALPALRPVLGPEKTARLEPVAAILSGATLHLTSERSGDALKMSATLTGIPDISPLVNRMLTEKLRPQRTKDEMRELLATRPSAEATVVAARKLAGQPSGAGGLRLAFDYLAVERQDAKAAGQVGDWLAQALSDDAAALNSLAWTLLTEKPYGPRFGDLARRLSRRSNELTLGKRWSYVDTLALAEFTCGNAREAVRLEQRAADLLKASGGDGGLADVLKALQRFRAGSARKAAKTPVRKSGKH